MKIVYYFFSIDGICIDEDTQLSVVGKEVEETNFEFKKCETSEEYIGVFDNTAYTFTAQFKLETNNERKMKGKPLLRGKANMYRFWRNIKILFFFRRYMIRGLFFIIFVF